MRVRHVLGVTLTVLAVGTTVASAETPRTWDAIKWTDKTASGPEFHVHMFGPTDNSSARGHFSFKGAARGMSGRIKCAYLNDHEAVVGIEDKLKHWQKGHARSLLRLFYLREPVGATPGQYRQISVEDYSVPPARCGYALGADIAESGDDLIKGKLRIYDN
jgi:hypothetical protein